MQSPDSQIIVARFFQALQTLKADKIIRGKKTFTNLYNINRWNLNTLESDHSRDIFQPAWLAYLVRDFHISPAWLLTGDGQFYVKGWDSDLVRQSVRQSLLKSPKTSNTQATKNQPSTTN